MNKKILKHNPLIIAFCTGFILFTSILISCKTSKTSYAPITIEVKAPELQAYHSITLWYSPNLYVENTPAISLYVLGTWRISKDTLICIPNITISEHKGVFSYNLIDPHDSTVLSIPQKFLMKKDRIENITDYSIIFNSLESEFIITPTLEENRNIILKKH